MRGTGEGGGGGCFVVGFGGGGGWGGGGGGFSRGGGGGACRRHGPGSSRSRDVLQSLAESRRRTGLDEWGGTVSASRDAPICASAGISSFERATPGVRRPGGALRRSVERLGHVSYRRSGLPEARWDVGASWEPRSCRRCVRVGHRDETVDDRSLAQARIPPSVPGGRPFLHSAVARAPGCACRAAQTDGLTRRRCLHAGGHPRAAEGGRVGRPPGALVVACAALRGARDSASRIAVAGRR